MDDLVVVKGPDHVVVAVHRLDVGQEGVAKAGALRGPLDQPCNVVDVQICRHRAVVVVVVVWWWCGGGGGGACWWRW